MAYAIIEDSGTQLKVEPGDRFEIDLRDLKDGQTTVTAKILGQIKDDKIYVERFTRRKGFHRRVGHRQKYLAVQVEAING